MDVKWREEIYFFNKDTRLKSVRCESLNFIGPKVRDLENLSLNYYNNCRHDDLSYFSQMAANENLKSFETTGYTNAFTGLTTWLMQK